MKCPFCLIEYHDKANRLANYADNGGRWEIIARTCSACNKTNLTLENVTYLPARSLSGPSERVINSSVLIVPYRAARPPCPSQVPSQYANDYNEACLVIRDSPKSSAALSRRCLQLILRDKANVKHSDLSNEIQEILDRGTLPQYLSQSIDAIRNIGNFAAHPLNREQSGLIVDVEPGEAEWSLDVLEGLFDFYFVQPEILASKRSALNEKLSGLGKPPMK